jgi:prevent-host-death family protein
MTETVFTIEDAARCFPELVERVHAGHEVALLVKAGQPVARIVPAKGPGRVADLIEFLSAWRLKHPEPDDQFARAIEESRRGVRPPRDPWQ